MYWMHVNLYNKSIKEESLVDKSGQEGLIYIRWN